MRIPADLSVDDKTIDTILKQFWQVVEKTIAQQFEKLKTEVQEKNELPQPPPPLVTMPKGVALPDSERLKAADIQTAILMGKVPEDAGLLIDLTTTAKLLSVSKRTVHRLVELKAIPSPIKLGGLVRWQLAELMEWLESGCPSRWQRPTPGRKHGRI